MIIKPGPNVTPYKPAVKPPTKPVGNPTEKPVGGAVTPPKTTAPSNPYGLDPAVYSAVSPQLTYLDQVQAQNQAALEGLTKAIMSQLGGMSGQIGDQYNQGIQQQQALAQEGSDSLRQANPNASVQSLLGAVGAPAEQGQQIANNLANTFGGGAAATFGRQGVLPVTRLIGDKLLQQNFASELPGIQSVAATNALKNLLASSNNEKLKVLSQVPQIQSDLAKSKLDQQKAASDLFFKNANLGLAKRKDAYNEWLGQKKLGLASQNQSFSQWAKTQGLKIQGQRVSIAQQNANTSAASAANRASKTGLKSTTVNGHIVTFDPNGVYGPPGGYYIPGTNTPVDTSSLKKPPKSPGVKALASARGYLTNAKQGYYASTNDSSTPLSTSTLQSIAKDSKMTLGALLAVTDPNQLAKMGLGYVAVGQNDDPKIQHLYVTLVKKYGIPAKQAFNMVASQYSQWGQAHKAAYFPKDSAAQDAAFGSGSVSQKAFAVTNLAKEALGTPYVWGGSKPGGFDCSGLLYYVWGKVGVPIPRTTYDQWSAGKPVGRGALQPGDAVFFKGSDSITRGGKTLPGHVGMYLGNGKIIEAPYTGANVQVTSLAGHGDYMGARRFA